MVTCIICGKEYNNNTAFCSKKCYDKNNYKNNKEKIKKKSRDYWANNPEIRANNKIRKKKKYWDNHEKELLRSKKWRDNNKEKINKQHQIIKEKLKYDMINHYSKGNMCCANLFNEHKKPYKTMDALTIDHINGNGNKHRKEIGVGCGYNFYFWLKKNGYPNGFQVLCMNCQFIKRAKNREI